MYTAFLSRTDMIYDLSELIYQFDSYVNIIICKYLTLHIFIKYFQLFYRRIIS